MCSSDLGGFGMNTGIGDAADLAWKIAAVEEGWGGTGLLSTYDTERRPIGTFNTLEAADNHAKSGDLFQVPATLESDGVEGDAVRASLAAKLPPKIKHFAPIGVHLGYHYDRSPIIIPDGTSPPPLTAASYAPTSRPGHGAPHVWLQDGCSSLDLFAPGFTLLRLGENLPDTAGLITAAQTQGLPLTLCAIDYAPLTALYQMPLVLVRPDGHVAWRGQMDPYNAAAIIARVRGA